MTTCLPQKSAGGRGDSILDRPPDSLVLLGDLVEDENWIYEGDESVASNEVIEGEEINGDDIPETAISQDPEVLELTQKLGNYLEKSQKKESESKEEDLDYEERLKRYTLHKEKKKKKKLGSASYMPNMRSKMYKEWLEEQFAKVIFYLFYFTLNLLIFYLFFSHFLLHLIFGEEMMKLLLNVLQLQILLHF